MDKATLDKLNGIATLNMMEVDFKEEEGAVIATARGVSFTVVTFKQFDSKLKEIRRMPPKKQSFFNRLMFRKGGRVS